MSNERRRRELEVLGAADALVSLWERGGSSRFLGETAEAVRNAMLALRSFEERAVADPLAEGSEWGLTQQAGLPVDQQSMPPGQAEEPVNRDARRDEEAMVDLHNRVGRIEGALAHSRLANIEAWLGRLHDRLDEVEKRPVPAGATQPAESDSGRAGVVVHAVSGDFCWLPPGASVRYDPEGPWPRSVQLPPHDERGVIAVAESALGKLCLEVATARWARHKLPRPSWRGDGEEVRLVWDEFLSGHDARLLP